MNKIFYISATEGSYVYIESNYQTDENDYAKLESDYIIATQQQCISFWYFKTNSKNSLHLLQNEDILLKVPEKEYRIWHQIQIPLEMTTYKSYKLGFEVIHGSNVNGAYGAIVIDDILIENQNCNCKYNVHVHVHHCTTVCLLCAFFNLFVTSKIKTISCHE